MRGIKKYFAVAFAAAMLAGFVTSAVMWKMLL